MRITTLMLAATSASILLACGNNDAEEIDVAEDRIEELQRDADAAMERTADIAARVEMMEKTYAVVNSSGFEIGTVTISDDSDGVDVDLDVTSMPEGAHALHFHAVGRCDGPDFTSAGGHYNPGNNEHGFDATDTPHAGDMRNFDAPASGVVSVERDNPRVSLSARSGYAPLLDSDGTALIIHAGADDYESQPSGAAGGRIACAVIN